MINKMLPFIFAFIILAGSCAQNAFADILTVENQGNTVVPVDAFERDEEQDWDTKQNWVAVKEKNISMESEIVRIEEAEYGFDVSCTFQMKSHAKEAITRNVAFPIVNPEYDQYMSQSFQVLVDGKPVKIKSVLNTNEHSWEFHRDWQMKPDSLVYAGYITWPVAWQAGETKRITCTYAMGEPERLWGFGFGIGWRLRYVVRTGGLWKGNIGWADISIKFQVDPRSTKQGRYTIVSHPQAQLRSSFPQQAKWVSGTEVRWRFKDWNPTEDILVEKIAWLGLHERYYFLLPPSYLGAEKPYTDAMLNELVEREIKPWKTIFPKAAAGLDKTRLKAFIAEVLYYEIYARHGDPFIVGKADQKPWPKDYMNESSDGYLYGKWKNYFWGYMMHGGWYRPNVTKKTKVALEEFNATELENLQFLQKHFEKVEAAS